MRVALSRMCVICSCFVLAGCKANFPTEYVKAGMSDAQAKADAEACWDWTLNTPEGQKKARLMRAALVLGGGVGAVASLSAQKSANDGDPRKELPNWQAFNICMVEKGYKAQR